MTGCEGSFHALLLYDIAEQVSLEKLRALLGAGAPARRPEFKLPTPSYVRFERPPVVQPCEPVRLPGGEQFDAQLKYFDYGVVSLGLEFKFQASWDELIALSARWIEAPDLDQHALELAKREVARVTPALVKPYAEWLDEVYYVIHLHEVRDADGNSLGGSELIARHAPGIAQIVRGERTPLSASEQAEVLASKMSFYPSDLLVVGWMAALILDTPEGAAPILQLLEYANTQLLEYRRYDEALTRVLEQAYDGLERRRGRLHRWRLAGEAERLNTLRLDITELAERTDNALKFLSDMYYARAYQLAAAKVGANDYRKLVETKLRTAGELYQFMVDQFHQARGFLLESLVVLILIIDLALLLGGHK